MFKFITTSTTKHRGIVSYLSDGLHPKSTVAGAVRFGWETCSEALGKTLTAFFILFWRWSVEGSVGVVHGPVRKVVRGLVRKVVRGLGG